MKRIPGFRKNVFNPLPVLLCPFAAQAVFHQGKRDGYGFKFFFFQYPGRVPPKPELTPFMIYLQRQLPCTPTVRAYSTGNLIQRKS